MSAIGGKADIGAKLERHSQAGAWWKERNRSNRPRNARPRRACSVSAKALFGRYPARWALVWRFSANDAQRRHRDRGGQCPCHSHSRKPGSCNRCRSRKLDSCNRYRPERNCSRCSRNRSRSHSRKPDCRNRSHNHSCKPGSRSRNRSTTAQRSRYRLPLPRPPPRGLQPHRHTVVAQDGADTIANSFAGAVERFERGHPLCLTNSNHCRKRIGPTSS